MVILPDGIRNYMTKFLSTAWMAENKYLPYEVLESDDHVLKGRKVSDLKLREVKPFVVSGATVGDVLNYFNQAGACPLLPLIEKEDSQILYGVAE